MQGLGGGGLEEDGQEGKCEVASTIAIHIWFYQCKNTFFVTLGESIALMNES